MYTWKCLKRNSICFFIVYLFSVKSTRNEKKQKNLRNIATTKIKKKLFIIIIINNK